MSRFSADTSVRTTIIKTLSYPTAAITITEKECNGLMSKIKEAALPKMGMNKKIGNAYLYGPKRFQGINFPNLYTKLCVEQIQMLLKHGGQTTQAGISLTSCLEGHQLETGVGMKLFDLDYNKYGFLATGSIITHTWRMLHETGMKMLTSHATPWLSQEHDLCIMQEIIEQSDYGISELKSINCCQMYLNVVSISDITEGNSTTVTANAYMGVKDPDQQIKWNWPTMPSPLRLIGINGEAPWNTPFYDKTRGFYVPSLVNGPKLHIRPGRGSSVPLQQRCTK